MSKVGNATTPRWKETAAHGGGIEMCFSARTSRSLLGNDEMAQQINWQIREDLASGSRIGDHPVSRFE
jgi:hypothetical protein